MCVINFYLQNETMNIHQQWLFHNYFFFLGAVVSEMGKSRFTFYFFFSSGNVWLGEVVLDTLEVTLVAAGVNTHFEWKKLEEHW